MLACLKFTKDISQDYVLGMSSKISTVSNNLYGKLASFAIRYRILKSFETFIFVVYNYESIIN